MPHVRTLTAFAVFAAFLVLAGTSHAVPVLTLTQTTNSRGGGTVDLTSEGTIDWIQFGASSTDSLIRKSATGLAAGLAVDRIKLTAQTGSFTDGEEQYMEATAWTDGTPVQSGATFRQARMVSNNAVSTWTFEVENIEKIEDGIFRYFTYHRGYQSTFAVEVRDMVTNALLGSDSISVDTTGSNNQFNQVLFAADPDIANPQKLVVTATADGWSTSSTNFRRFGINAATLGGTIIPDPVQEAPAVPEPASMALVAAGLASVLLRRKRAMTI